MADTDLITSIIVAAFTSLATYTVNFVENNRDIIKQRYFEFISPAFELLDNYYKSSENNFAVQIALKKVFQLAEEHKDIIGGDIRGAIYSYQNASGKKKKKAYKKLCTIISKEHDRACESLLIPTRTKEYKKAKGQPYHYSVMRRSLGKTFVTAITCLAIGILSGSICYGTIKALKLLFTFFASLLLK